MIVDGRARNRRAELEHIASMVAFAVNNMPGPRARNSRAKSVDDVIGMSPWKTAALKKKARRKFLEAQREKEQS